MPQNAKQSIDQCMSTLRSTTENLEQALNSAEKQENKKKIQQAISSISSAQQQLSEYQD
ncbi:hypothetical protein [Alkalibaculum sporogenes]|uniref:hypothetical protein n=1 Tax=Alkalibaculum sporogenes TaxID=2655001 RepID=UPI00187B8B9F|nr:hypothetical protein [Alkalibaculum sporogenes]